MPHDASSRPAPAPLRVAFVPGVTPGKWARIWAERMPSVPLELVPVADHEQRTVLEDGRADLCFLRLPVDPDGLSVIPLYREVPVAVVPVEHPVAAYDEIAVADLADEHLLQDPDTVPEWRDLATEVRDGTRVDVPADLPMRTAVEVVAAGVGIVIVPKSVARLHNRKDVAHCPVTGVAGSQVGLAWPAEATDERIETFIGVVRGRTARSSRDPEPRAETASGTAKASGGQAPSKKPGSSTGRSPGQSTGQSRARTSGQRRGQPGRSGTPRVGRRGRR